MKFLAVFVTLAAVACGFPATTTWTLNELSNALQSPGTDPALIPALQEALNQMMYALHHGHAMETITIDMPVVVEFDLPQLAAALQNPQTNPAYIPVLEEALNQLMDALYAGQEKPTVTVTLPAVLPANKPESIDIWPVQTPEEEPSFIDIWPVQTPEEEPSFIDVWPVQTPDVADIAPPASVAAAAPSSPLVQIIVNVQSPEAVDVPAGGVIERPTPEQSFDHLPGWGNFIGDH